MKNLIRVPIGGMGIGREEQLIYTVLGSCVAIMLYDKPRKIGGMIHIMLPYSRGRTDLITKYADTGIPHLIDRMVAAGANPDHLTGAKITGGSEMFEVLEKESNVSIQNVAAAQKILQDLNIKVLASDFGGIMGRRVEFNVNTGKVQIHIEGHQTRII